MQKVVIATMTLARTEEEEQLLRKALEKLARLDLPVVVADGGSRPEFVQFLSDLKFVVLQPEANGLVAQIVASTQEAVRQTPEGWVCYTEPDKYEFFDNGLPELLKQEPEADLLLVARSPEDFATFPAFQFFSETTINRIAGELMGLIGDYSYGPILFKAPLGKFVPTKPSDLAWGWRFQMVGAAFANGHRIAFPALGAPCQVSQRNENTEADKKYRLRQMEQNIRGLLTGLNINAHR